MEYTVEDISPVKKKITITAEADEVSAAINAATALYRKNVQMDGFRKGKAPLPVVEKRFHDPIYKEARDDLINVHINEALGKHELKPLGGIMVKGEEMPLEKGKPFVYSIEFEVLPRFDLPNYEGLEVEEEEPDVEPEIIDHMIRRMQRERGSLVPVEGNGPAASGQIANLDFETILDGESVPAFSAMNFDLALDEGGALPEFEEFVKTIPVGHTAEKTIHFPDDFIAPELAGKDPLMRVTIHAVKERKLPEADDKFAEQFGHADMNAMRENLAKAYKKGMGQLTKGVAQKKLLDSLVRQCEFDLPEQMVDAEANFLVGDMLADAQKQGKNLAKTQEEFDKLRQEVLPKARERTREKIVLLTIADREKLAVSNDEVERELYRNALKMGVDAIEYLDNMRDTGMIFLLRDTLLCDKAMDLVYERANVKMVEPARKQDAEAGQDSQNTDNQ